MMALVQFFDMLLSLKDLSGVQLRNLSFHIQKRLEKDELNQAMETRVRQLDHCIFCDSDKIILWGFVGDLQRYRCNKCGKTFNELTNTPFDHLQSRGETGALGWLYDEWCHAQSRSYLL